MLVGAAYCREPDIAQAFDIGIDSPATPAAPVGDQDPEVDPLSEPVVGREEDAVLERPAPLWIRDDPRPAIRRIEVLSQSSEADGQRSGMKVSLLDDAPDQEVRRSPGSAYPRPRWHSGEEREHRPNEGRANSLCATS